MYFAQYFSSWSCGSIRVLHLYYKVGDVSSWSCGGALRECSNYKIAMSRGSLTKYCLTKEIVQRCWGVWFVVRNENQETAMPLVSSVIRKARRFRPRTVREQMSSLAQVEKHKEKLQVVLHGTNEKNLNSIYQKGLLVPSCDNNVKVLHGSSHGKGIYTAKTINARLAYGFALGSSRALLVCGVIDDAVALPERVACGNHFITAQSDHVRHVGDAIVVFDESRLLPLFEVSHATPQLAPPPGHGTTSAPAAPAVSRAPLPVPGKSRGKLDGPKTRLPKKYCPHTERRAARKRRL